MNKTAYEPTERRPIASRDLAISGRIAAALANAGVSPTAISIFGMIAAIVAGAALYFTRVDGAIARCLWILAACGVQLRLLANLFDGMVAIQQGRASAVGELFNEVPDRISDAAILVGLGY